MTIVSTPLFFLLLVPFLFIVDQFSKETQSPFKTPALLNTVNQGMQKALPHTCQAAPFQTLFLPLDPMICKDHAYSLGHRPVSALMLRSTTESVPNLYHAHRSLCFPFLYKGLEQVPHFGPPDEKNLRTDTAKDVENFFLPVRRSKINLKQAPTVAHSSM